ncbi:MAG: TonB-dependent receptor [Candidatus Pseudobacter hemicellulosilyticus]|uniref:TonB-dependent receptor n=1 Tax=Candidatus Pseudobacter hemicellulosilyticus TaxID=3121375 RepID=A0AAJ6BH59_9BACT|nr:MAG: TonB-dependent receptor [Pseudobacter sp.]
MDKSLTFIKTKGWIPMLCCLLFLHSSLQAQEPVISISPQTLEVKAVLDQLQQKGGINFMYSDLGNELSRKITLSPASGAISALLQQLTNQTNLSFHRSGNTIAIKLSVADKGKGTVQGVVTDAARLPVAGVTVTLSGGQRITVTDEQGRFTFKELPVGKYTLQLTHVSYADKQQQLTISNGKTSNIQIVLSPSEASSAMNPVVVTGQYRPQSLNKSIYRVEVIDKKQIQNMAVSTVAELLKQQLNIEIENQSGLGRAKIRVLGLNSQYMKILMDNIPIAGDENMGSDVDLSTISLDDVERVEIVKGAMGVEYGANSISGVINIITKKTSRNKTDLTFELQEETVRNEYNLSGKPEAKGRHIQRMNLSHKLKDNLSIGGSVSRDQFNGYWGEREGAGLILDAIDPYYPPQRGYEWSPKISWNGNAYISRTGKRLNLFYKFNYFTSQLTNYGQVPTGFLLKDEQIIINAGVNNDYRNERYNQHLSIRGDFWKDAYYSVDVSLQKNGLEHRRQAINLEDNSVLDKSYGIPGSERLKATDWQKYYQSQGFYAKGTLLKPIVTDKLDYNLGFEMDNTTGNQGYTSWFNDVSLSTPVEKTLFTGAAYSSFEWNVSKKIMVRPGFRVNYSSHLHMRTNQSVTTRYRLNDRNDLRLIVGTSTRFPNYEELYSWFVDAVHDYRGNPDLRPEYGKSAELQWAHHRELKSNLRLETSLSSLFQHINDRIVSITYREPGQTQLTGRNTYTNENKYNGLLNQLNINLVSDKFNIALAGSVLAYRGDDDATANNYKGFLSTTQGSAQFTYVFPLAIRVAVFYRYVGRQPMYSFIPQGPIGPDLQPAGYLKVLNKTDAYHNMDCNIARSFWKEKLDLRLGVRDLFDVRDISYKAIDPPPGITGQTQTIRLFYGRSYFVKLSYNLFN